LVWFFSFYLCLLPWAVRNYVDFGLVVPISVGGGYALWAGSHPGPYPEIADYPKFIAPYEPTDPRADQLATAKAKLLYQANAVKILLDLPKRSFHFWFTSHSAIFGYTESFGEYWGNRDYRAVVVKIGGFILQGALLLFALCGAVRCRRETELYMPMAIILYTWALVALTDYWPNRYHVPLIPLLIYIGAYRL
jgi:hypothetical protein